jgi:hypothetical protein
MAGNIELHEMEVGPNSRWTATGRYVLHFTPTGNLEVWNIPARKRLWESGTAGRGAAKLSMQSDGNLVIYDLLKQPLWDSGTAGNRGAMLAVQDDGNVVIYSADKRPLWNTGTYHE